MDLQYTSQRARVHIPPSRRFSPKKSIFKLGKRGLKLVEIGRTDSYNLDKLVEIGQDLLHEFEGSFVHS